MCVCLFALPRTNLHDSSLPHTKNPMARAPLFNHDSFAAPTTNANTSNTEKVGLECPHQHQASLSGYSLISIFTDTVKTQPARHHTSAHSRSPSSHPPAPTGYPDWSLPFSKPNFPPVSPGGSFKGPFHYKPGSCLKPGSIWGAPNALCSLRMLLVPTLPFLGIQCLSWSPLFLSAQDFQPLIESTSPIKCHLQKPGHLLCLLWAAFQPPHLHEHLTGGK